MLTSQNKHIPILMVAFPFRLLPRTIVLLFCLAVLGGSFTEGDVIHWYWKREPGDISHRSQGLHFNWSWGRYSTLIKFCNFQFSDPKLNNDTVFNKTETPPDLEAAVLTTMPPMHQSHLISLQRAEKDRDTLLKAERTCNYREILFTGLKQVIPLTSHSFHSGGPFW